MKQSRRHPKSSTKQDREIMLLFLSTLRLVVKKIWKQKKSDDLMLAKLFLSGLIRSSQLGKNRKRTLFVGPKRLIMKQSRKNQRSSQNSSKHNGSNHLNILLNG